MRALRVRRMRFALALALALAWCPSAAHAAEDWQGTTAIVVTSAPKGQISISAPVTLPLALRTDGGVLDGAAVELRNLSSTPVAVANIRVEARNGVTVVRSSEAEGLTTTDLLHMRFTPPGSPGVEACDCLGTGLAPPDFQNWRAESGQTLAIGIEGGFLNPSETFTSSYDSARPVAAATVVWTVEAQ